MNEINSSFARAEQVLPLLHIFSAILLISAQFCAIFCIRFYEKFSISIDKILNFIAFYEKIFFILFGCLALSGIFMSRNSFIDPMINAIFVTKWVCAIFIFINFIYMHYEILLLKKALQNGDNNQNSDFLAIITKYFTPLNIVVCFICVYLGFVIKDIA